MPHAEAAATLTANRLPVRWRRSRPAQGPRRGLLRPAQGRSACLSGSRRPAASTDRLLSTAAAIGPHAGGSAAAAVASRGGAGCVTVAALRCGRSAPDGPAG
jgi:hypothetical protein